jgi:hypothetical protein
VGVNRRRIRRRSAACAQGGGCLCQELLGGGIQGLCGQRKSPASEEFQAPRRRSRLRHAREVNEKRVAEPEATRLTARLDSTFAERKWLTRV